MTRDIFVRLQPYQYSGINLISFIASYSVRNRSPPSYRIHIISRIATMQVLSRKLHGKKYILGEKNVR